MEDSIIVKPDTTELESATENAERSAELANESAIAATAAAINQGQIIEVVTAAAREDAERARQQSEAAADESERAAELSAVIAETAITEIRSMMEEHNRRLSALEYSRSEPIQVVGEENVSPINPQDTEQEERSEDMEEGEQNKPSRKRHGRKRR